MTYKIIRLLGYRINRMITYHIRLLIILNYRINKINAMQCNRMQCEFCEVQCGTILMCALRLQHPDILRVEPTSSFLGLPAPRWSCYPPNISPVHTVGGSVQAYHKHITPTYHQVGIHTMCVRYTTISQDLQ